MIVFHYLTWILIGLIIGLVIGLIIVWRLQHNSQDERLRREVQLRRRLQKISEDRMDATPAVVELRYHNQVIATAIDAVLAGKRTGKGPPN